MDGGSRTDAASGKDPHRGCHPTRWLRLSWVPLRTRSEMATSQESQEVKRHVRAKTRRTNGQSLQAIIANVNRTTRGWFGYFKHSHRYTFEPLDRLMRTRLRSILRKRSGQRGRGRGADHRRWSNEFFAAHGLFSFVAAHAQL